MTPGVKGLIKKRKQLINIKMYKSIVNIQLLRIYLLFEEQMIIYPIIFHIN